MVTLTLNNYFDRERHEIEESFEALDAEKTGRLGIEHAYSILLGLGYIADYKKKDEFSPATLEEAAKEIERAESGDHDDSDWISGITLETLLKVVDTHPALSKGSQAENFAARCFDLVDRDQKGYLVASDIEHLGREVEMVDNLSPDEASEMIEITNKIFASVTTSANGNDNNQDNESQHRLQPSVFEKMFAPSFH